MTVHSNKTRRQRNAPVLLRVYDSQGRLVREVERKFTLRDRWKRFQAQEQALNRMRIKSCASAEVIDNGVIHYFIVRDGKALTPAFRFCGDLGSRYF